jgi:hypothetical protein
MNPKPSILLAASLLFAACDAPQEEETSSGGGSTSSSGTDSTPTGTPTGPQPGETVTIQMGSFEIAPGGEVYKCQNFANPFGADVEIGMFESHMTKGSHHLLLFYTDEGTGDGPLTDCSGLEFGPTPYSTQLPDDTSAFPEGVAMAIPGKQGLRLQSHYLNVTAEPLTVNVEVTFHLVDPAAVTDHAGVMFIVQPDIEIPPSSTQDVTYDCTIPIDMFIMKAASHMHKHGTKFVATVQGAPLYETDTWDEPKPALFDPPMPLQAGAPLHFACTFVNPSPDTLTFGESAESDEMCILGMTYYPAPVGLPTIPCN